MKTLKIYISYPLNINKHLIMFDFSKVSSIKKNSEIPEGLYCLVKPSKFNYLETEKQDSCEKLLCPHRSLQEESIRTAYKAFRVSLKSRKLCAHWSANFFSKILYTGYYKNICWNNRQNIFSCYYRRFTDWLEEIQ